LFFLLEFISIFAVFLCVYSIAINYVYFATNFFTEGGKNLQYFLKSHLILASISAIIIRYKYI